jgi:hypothetical protein
MLTSCLHLQHFSPFAFQLTDFTPGWIYFILFLSCPQRRIVPVPPAQQQNQPRTNSCVNAQIVNERKQPPNEQTNKRPPPNEPNKTTTTTTTTTSNEQNKNPPKHPPRTRKHILPTDGDGNVVVAAAIDLFDRVILQIRPDPLRFPREIPTVHPSLRVVRLFPPQFPGVTPPKRIHVARQGHHQGMVFPPTDGTDHPDLFATFQIHDPMGQVHLFSMHSVRVTPQLAVVVQPKTVPKKSNRNKALVLVLLVIDSPTPTRSTDDLDACTPVTRPCVV